MGCDMIEEKEGSEGKSGSGEGVEYMLSAD